MKTVAIGDRLIGRTESPYIVAELSGNHRQSLAHAKKLIQAAAKAGVDAVKLQTYTPDTLTLPIRNPLFKLNDGLWSGHYLYDLYAEAMTPWEWHSELANYAQELGIQLFSTPFDATAVDYLEAQVQPAVYKIASFELNHLPLLRKVGALGKPVILSTGMAALGEIELAVGTLREAGSGPIILLKCVSAYPADPADFNLKGMVTLAEHFDCLVGVSDHSLGSEICHAAVALGACVIEKHLVLDRGDGSVDSGFSIEPEEFAQLVASVRRLHLGLGSGDLADVPPDRAQQRFRRSIFACAAIDKGEEFSENNLKIVRPSDGLEPAHWQAVLGKIATRSIAAGEPLSWDMVEGHPCSLVSKSKSKRTK